MTERCAIPQRVLDLKIANLLDHHFNAAHPGHGTYGRIRNLFQWSEPPIETVGDLVKLSNRELAHTPNIGKKTIVEIEAMLEGLKIRLAYHKGSAPTYFGALELPDSIYRMKLHEVMAVDNCHEVMRVHGGWIYKFWEHSVFVPEHGGTPCA